MEFKKSRVLQWDISPKAIILVCTLAVVIVVALWIAGVDDVAMKILLASLLFGLAAYVSYLDDPRQGEVSLSQGAVGGGILMLLYFVVVVCRHSLETRGMLLPSSFVELALFLVSATFSTLFSAGVGAMIAVIGDSVLRTTHAMAHRWSMSKEGKSKRQIDL